ncbi:(deoxy)nucleoside triphosphate pyrophosphohydrolase [Microbacterium kribbense]|uniref:8-oxo-dGTP diphosphatase n=1 Tax=Microbacterium kribbense TaxID=433645 RepID=A0ABP7GID6_9MICO
MAEPPASAAHAPSGAALRRIDVVGAAIIRDGLILCAQRGAGSVLAGLWEFPGGKIEPGETARAALSREIAEELQCEVTVGAQLTRTIHDYDFGTVVLTTFACRLTAGTPRLTEHAAMRWLAPAELDLLEWAPADIPTVRLLQHPSAPARD